MFKQTVLNNTPKMTLHVSGGRLPSIKGNICNTHYHDEVELLVIMCGSMSCTAEGETRTAHAGEVIFVNSDIPHSTVVLEEGTTFGIVQFKKNDFIITDIPEIISYSTVSSRLTEVACTTIKDAMLFGALTEIIDEFYEQSVGYDMFIRSAIYRVMGYLYREGIISEVNGIHDTKEVRKILPALIHINTAYYEDITLESASEMLSFDPSYFCRIFKLATGATFTEYLNFVRICNSERLLADGEKSILEISEAVGFSSVSYFNRIFKKHKGCSPRSYRSAKFNANM